MHYATKTILGTCVLALAGLGCGAAAPPPEIASAQRELTLAHDGEAGRRVPAELLVAERTLRAAERAQRDHPRTTQARDLAYISHRQTLIAEAHARSIGIGEATGEEQDAYQAGLESSNRDARAERATDRAAIASSRDLAFQQNRTIAQQRDDIEDAEMARDTADASAADAMRRLDDLAAVQVLPDRTTITILGSVLFRSGGSTLLAGASGRLIAVADALSSQPSREITIEGFTDSRGSESSNETLSLARAESVRTFLVGHGVESDRVRAVGIGEARPVGDNATSEGRANNRRVEIVLGPLPREVSMR